MFALRKPGDEQFSEQHNTACIKQVPKEEQYETENELVRFIYVVSLGEGFVPLSTSG